MPACNNGGYDHELCLRHPESHFAIFAVNNLANWLSVVQHRLPESTVSIGLETSDLVKDFFTPRKDPTQLIFPFSIVGGIAAGMYSPSPFRSNLMAIPTKLGQSSHESLYKWATRHQMLILFLRRLRSIGLTIVVAISGFAGPAAIIAGAAGIVNGALTQAG